MQQPNDFIDAQDWPADMKERAKLVVKSRTERRLPAMTAEQWQEWFQRFGPAAV